MTRYSFPISSDASPGPVERVVGRLLRRRQLRNSKLLPTLLGVPEIVLRLLVEPALGGRPKGNRKTDRHLWADPGPAIQNGGQGLTADSKRFCSLRDGDAKWLQTKALDDLARMGRVVHTHRRYSLSDSPRNRRRPLPCQRTGTSPASCRSPTRPTCPCGRPRADEVSAPEAPCLVAKWRHSPGPRSDAAVQHVVPGRRPLSRSRRSSLTPCA